MKLPCYLIRDLLPLYQDDVCDPQTATDVREHLEDCPDCRHLWETMQATAPVERDMVAAREREQTAALRRVKRTQRKKRLLTVLVTLLAVVLLCFGGWTLYDRANTTYLDYPQEAILGVEEEALSDEWLIKGQGIVLKLDPEEMASVHWTRVLDTVGGDTLVFTLGRSQWHAWTHAQWGDDTEDGSHEIILYSEALNGREEMENLKAVYYLPYAEFEAWFDIVARQVPKDAVLLWQRDTASETK